MRNMTFILPHTTDPHVLHWACSVCSVCGVCAVCGVCGGCVFTKIHDLISVDNEPLAV